jgi:hypothetical protein
MVRDYRSSLALEGGDVPIAPGSEPPRTERTTIARPDQGWVIPALIGHPPRSKAGEKRRM